MIREKNLLVRIRQHDVDAFNILFNTYYMQLYCYCRKYVSEIEAKDILQNVFLRFWEKRKNIDIHSSAKAYLYKSIQYECLNYIRSKKLKEDSTDISSKEIADQSNIPDVDVVYREIEIILESVIDKLPPQSKKIFTESRINGMKNFEIAQKLNVSVRTVDTQIYRVLKILKVKLKDYLAT